MTVLTACREAAIELNGDQPASLFSSTEQFDLELRTQANKSATAILAAYDWQKQHALHTLTGDGTTVDFSLPSNYQRMLKNTEVLTTSFGQRLVKARDANQWLDFQINSLVVAAPGYWIILGGLISIRPAIATGVTAKFYYIKNTVVTGAAAAQQTGFVADDDTFNLPERLLTLDIIWRWRAQKRKDYAEDMKNFEIALSEEIGTDKGSRILTIGRQRLGIDADLAHPAIVP